MTKSPVGLIILDGFACRDEIKGNAVKAAKKPNFDRYWKRFPHNTLRADGEFVGLPEGQMGNSEVGHMNIGAGRIVYQSLTRIHKSIEDGDFFNIEEFVKCMTRLKQDGKALHLMGLVSDGGVHSHIDHLIALVKLAKQHDLKEVYIHAFLDGRDVGPSTGLGYIEQLEKALEEIGLGQISTVSGRYYAMDRDKRWDRIQKAYQAIVNGQGPSFSSASEGIQVSYDAEIYDEFVVPFVIENNKEAVGQISDNDAVIFFNFRPDRAIQLSTALSNSDFSEFGRMNPPENLEFISFTEYSDAVKGQIAFKKVNLVNTIGEVIAKADKTQLRIAETEKYPHVTFFMSGGRHEAFPGEERILINSPKVATYDLQPEMSAYEVKDALIEKIQEDVIDGIILNFANPDMVGHSGMLEPTVKAIEAVDECLGQIVDLILSKGGTAIITADHGNSDEVVDMEGNPMTAHTTNPVPIIITKESVDISDGGILADLAPTMLKLMGIDQPEEMTGRPLI